ncbi:MAG: thioredoxin family protein [Sedimentisphaerales bacterium]|nr:thioredoxin family protein [Sedimentisphaerales bacterium]
MIAPNSINREGRIRKKVGFWGGFGVLLVGVMWLVGIYGSNGGEVMAQVPGLQLAGAGAGQGEARVGIEVVSQFEPAGAGERMAVAVVLEVKEGWHLYANPKQGDLGLDTEIIPEAVEGVRFGEVIYPPGEKYEDKVLGSSNHIYEGRAVCYVPVEVAKDVAAGSKIVVALQLKGLLCSDAGQCVPWEDAAGLEIAVGEQGVVNREELFAGLDLSGVDWGEAEQKGVVGDVGDGEIAVDDWVKPILLALVAGLVMNLMPCVLPLIPIIVLTLMKQCSAEEGQEPDRGKSVRVGLAFAAGILVVFAGLAVLMSVFKMAWGQQFQGTGFKLGLLLVVYVLSLSMFGLFEIALPSKVSNMQVMRGGYAGAMGMGMLATVLATPCGAPLLGPVLGWSLAKPLAVMVVMFLVIGAGMALPYVVLTAFPKLLNRVPKGGNWMIRLKQVIGFMMLGFAVYLIGLFPGGWRVPLMYFCVVVGFCVWLGLGVVNRNSKAGLRWGARLAAVVLLVVGSYGLAVMDKGEVGVSDWQAELREHQEAGRTVIVKFTANWCKNCSVLDKLIYKTETFQQKLQETGAALVVADGSYPDERFNEIVQELGGPGQGIPLAAIYPKGREEGVIVLRGLYSMKDVLGALDKASAAGGGD